MLTAVADRPTAPEFLDDDEPTVAFDPPEDEPMRPVAPRFIDQKSVEIEPALLESVADALPRGPTKPPPPDEPSADWTDMDNMPLPISRAPLPQTAQVRSGGVGISSTVIAAIVLLVAAAGIVIAIGLSGPSATPPEHAALVPDANRRPTAIDAAPSAATPAPDLAAIVELPPDAAPEIVPDATDQIALTVESSPPRGSVYLDGIKQCEAPCTIENLDPRHIYLLSVRRKNYVSWSQLVDMRRSRNTRLTAYLAEEPDSRRVGYLVVRCSPRAEVSVDGAAIGRVTSEGRIALSPGHHEIALSSPRRRRRVRFVVNIRRQRTTIVRKRF